MSQSPYRAPEVSAGPFDDRKQPCGACGTKTLTTVVIIVPNPRGWVADETRIPACSNTCAEALISARQVAEAIAPTIVPESRSHSGVDVIGTMIRQRLGAPLQPDPGPMLMPKPIDMERSGVSAEEAANKLREMIRKLGM